MPICTILTRPFLFADYEEMSRHFKNLYFKVCQIPFRHGQNDHQTTVVNFIRDYANDNNPTDYRTGETPLHTAAYRNDQLTVLLILQYAKDKNPAAKDGETPLHWAAGPGRLETVKLLLEYAKDKNPVTKDGWTALHSAARYGQLETVKLLLEHAKDKNPAAKDGRTPLHWAAQEGELEIVKLLLEHAKDKNPADNEDKTPLYLATHYGRRRRGRGRGYVKIVKLIREFNKDL
jgi:ankyrin repeat protein